MLVPEAASLHIRHGCLCSGESTRAPQIPSDLPRTRTFAFVVRKHVGMPAQSARGKPDHKAGARAAEERKPRTWAPRRRCGMLRQLSWFQRHSECEGVRTATVQVAMRRRWTWPFSAGGYVC